MIRIVDANGKPWKWQDGPKAGCVAFVGQATAHFEVKAYDLGNGHVEASASRVTAWHETDWTPQYMQEVQEVIIKAKSEQDAEEAAAANLLRAARRAKTRVRRLCKVMGADTLLTLTYRALQGDLDLCKRHLKEFNRRMLRVLPGFAFVACFELQKRGAWHVHLATRNIPAALPGQSGEWRSFNVIRAIWRSVTGELGGNIDLQRRKHHSQKSAAQVASYIAKYIGKGFEDAGMAAGKNRWTNYGQADVPQPVHLGVHPTLHAAMEATYGVLLDVHQVATARLDHWQDWFFVSGELRKRNWVPNLSTLTGD